MKRVSLITAMLMGSAMTGHGAYAHHSFAATYFVDKEITLSGTVVQLLYRNPHSFIKVTVKDDKGNLTTWSGEWGGGAQLAQDNVNRETLKPGDKITMTGNPGRNLEEHRVRVHKVERPSDGWKWEGVIM